MLVAEPWVTAGKIRYATMALAPGGKECAENVAGKKKFKGAAQTAPSVGESCSGTKTASQIIEKHGF